MDDFQALMALPTWWAGLGMTVIKSRQVVMVPIRSGLGARLGINVGYLKFTQEPTWNPF